MSEELEKRVADIAKVVRMQIDDITKLQKSAIEMQQHQIAIQAAFAGFALALARKGALSADDIAVAIQDVRSNEAWRAGTDQSFQRYLDGLEKAMLAVAAHTHAPPPSKGH